LRCRISDLLSLSNLKIFKDNQPWAGKKPISSWFIIRSTSSVLTEEEIKKWINPKLAKYQRLSGVEFRTEDFPRNALGKVLKRFLREPYWRKG